MHNTYSDNDKSARYSRHQIGAEVDFYVEGYENRPEEVVEVIQSYYQTPSNPISYKRFSKKRHGIQNKEIRVSIAQVGEKRDGDNRHPYPYITIEVLYDRAKKKSVQYTWHKAALVKSKNEE
jgi:hypothetical protein